MAENAGSAQRSKTARAGQRKAPFYDAEGAALHGGGAQTDFLLGEGSANGQAAGGGVGGSGGGFGGGCDVDGGVGSGDTPNEQAAGSGVGAVGSRLGPNIVSGPFAWNCESKPYLFNLDT